VDLSGEMLNQARRRAASLGLCAGSEAAEAGPAVRFVRGDATALPFQAAAFDTVLDTFSLCVLGDAAPRALAEMARVLRPRGCVSRPLPPRAKQSRPPRSMHIQRRDAALLRFRVASVSASQQH
jgi:ubiquinone/menaquinone biosynthesis C-methylase UbiE